MFEKAIAMYNLINSACQGIKTVLDQAYGRLTVFVQSAPSQPVAQKIFRLLVDEYLARAAMAEEETWCVCVRVWVCVCVKWF